MNPNINSIKQALQRHLTSGLVVIIGSGLSCAEGLPGMKELTQHLAQADPSSAGIELADGSWEELVAAIRKDGIEAALHQNQVDEPLADFIRTETARCIRGPEAEAIKQILAGSRQLKWFAR
jgi:hypothetical protein